MSVWVGLRSATEPMLDDVERAGEGAAAGVPTLGRHTIVDPPDPIWRVRVLGGAAVLVFAAALQDAAGLSTACIGHVDGANRPTGCLQIRDS